MTRTSRTRLPLPFDDAAIVVEGRLRDAGLHIRSRQDGPGPTRTWRARTGHVAWFARGFLPLPSVSRKVEVTLAAQGPKDCEVVTTTAADDLIVLMEFLDVGAGQRVREAMHGPSTPWTAGRK